MPLEVGFKSRRAVSGLTWLTLEGEDQFLLKATFNIPSMARYMKGQV